MAEIRHNKRKITDTFFVAIVSENLYSIIKSVADADGKMCILEDSTAHLLNSCSIFTTKTESNEYFKAYRMKVSL